MARVMIDRMNDFIYPSIQFYIMAIALMAISRNDRTIELHKRRRRRRRLAVARRRLHARAATKLYCSRRCRRLNSETALYILQMPRF